MFASPGGWGRTSAGLGGAGQTTYTGRLSDHSTVTGGDGTTSLGGTAGNGGAGGGSGAAGSVPGGGGGPGVTSGVAGGNGAPGQVKFTWYGRSSSANRLRHFLAGGSWIKAGAAGANRNIPASGTINLRDFLSFEEIGHYANASFEFSITNGTGGTQWANCKVQADGSFASPGVQYPAQTWMRRILGNDSSTITQHFDVLFNRTAASGYDTTLYGSAANTWLQCSSEPSWNVKAFLSGYGSVTSTATGYLAFRRRSDNVVVINVPATISATSFLEDPGPCPTCCFTPETPITMADYTTKPIGEVRIGDLILSRTGAKMVSEIIVREKREMHVIRFADGRELNASEDHPLYVKGKGYASVRPTVEYKDLGVPAILSEGDLVIDQNGNENEIVSITDLYYPHEVYTFAETEFYANGMLVY
jgi:hypothetical protein